MGYVTLGDLLVWLAVASAAAAGATAARRRFQLLLPMSAALLTVALGRLALGFATEEWALDYVADHARADLAAPIRVAGLWAGAEGSLLLWTVMVAWVAVLAARGWDAQPDPEVATADRGPSPGPSGALPADAARAWSVRLGAGVVTGYALLVALVASPFERSAVPAVGGLGLQPVLEYPAMIWHPPILYAGLVGLLLPAIRSAATMLCGSPIGSPVVGDVRSSASLAVAMAVLTAGLTTGALWAAVELGWGGYWAWDPIESAGLVAWLCGAAALHVSSGRAEADGRRRRDDRGWIGALLVVPGVAAIWATTLTRVGLVASVHAFADRPALRTGLLVVAAVATGVAAAAVAVGRRSGTTSPGKGRVVAAAALMVAALIVAIGTYEPLVEAGTTGDAVAVAGHYYTRLLWPVTIVGAALALRADRRWWWAIGGGVLGALAVPVAAGPFALAVASAGGAVASSAVGCGATAADRRPGRAGMLAHVGVGVALVGVAGTIDTSASTVTVPTGQTVTAGGMTVTHRSLELVDGPATDEAVATVDVDGSVYRPRLVSYELRGVSTSETATRMIGVDQVQVRLVDGNDRAARYRIIRLPRIGLVWVGAAIVTTGLLAQPLRRLRARSSDSVDDAPSPSPSGSDPVPGSEGLDESSPVADGATR